jgi:hypothetical protein
MSRPRKRSHGAATMPTFVVQGIYIDERGWDPSDDIRPR